MKTDSELVELLRVGSDEAFAALYERYSAPLFNHLICMVGKREVAEELLHEVFITMISKIGFYQEHSELRNSFKAWLYRIATNRAIDEIRKHKNVRVEFEITEEATTNAEESFEQLQRHHLIQSLVARLPLIQRTFLNLKLNDDLNHFEISQICSCNVNTVKQGLFQARRSLKLMLLAEGFEL